MNSSKFSQRIAVDLVKMLHLRRREPLLQRVQPCVYRGATSNPREVEEPILLSRIWRRIAYPSVKQNAIRRLCHREQESSNRYFLQS